MFETHSQLTNGHLSTGIAESFFGSKGNTANSPGIGIHSPVEMITKPDLPEIHILNTIKSLADLMPIDSQFCG
jgi:hypothetical protein